MKEWILRIVAGLVVVAILAVAAVVFCINGIVKKGVDTVGPRITKVEVKLDSAHISIFSGSASLKELFVGNPPGYTSPSAIKVGDISVRLKPMSVMSDKIIVDKVDVKAPEITYEGGLTGNNLSKIENNIKGTSSASSSTGNAPAENGTKKKLQVTDLLISGATLHVKSKLMANKTLTVKLPDIHLTNLGTGSNGITPAELTDQVMHALMQEVIPAVTKVASQAGSEALGLGNGATQQGEDAAKKAGGKLKGLFGQ